MFKKERVIAFLVFIIGLSLAAGIFSYEPVWKKISSFRPWSMGLDLAGGTLLIYEVDTSSIAPADVDSVVKGLRDVIEKRVNLFGVSEPKVYSEQTNGKERLIVELAGIKDVNAAIKEIGLTPFLEFREIQGEGTSTISIPTELNGRYIKSTQMEFDSVTGKPFVSLEFTEEGGKIFETVTERNVGKYLGIFLDNEAIEIPKVEEKISGGSARISGNFTVDSARKLVERFNAGALPAAITLVNQQTISPDLGKDSLDKAIFAGIFGTILVMLFMIVYYRRLGVFAAGALLMYVALSLGIFKLLGITMTLSGIAGFLLSIGMAVDANILVFERTKEELKRGLSEASAVEEGFKRAWTSIRDSNISTMITSGVLYYFTSSFVRGFALTLFLGVVVSMFSAITITRSMLRVFHVKKVQK